MYTFTNQIELVKKSYGLQWLCHLTPTHGGYRRWRWSASEVCRCELGFTFGSYGCTGTRQATVGCHLQVNCCDEIQLCANC
ncbi:hypothetical protein CKAN_00647300 [Cinnamomum micranthum f. kanehirae]|uniref:Uncharacterized protein n=1 Tax=Cinnamomum micranthum f. kanehirae TaxID=337451 RepID=A0A3S3MZL1_9MAGN|nr:hypothetical protein CKAN_00647300 [Cinnamomum micranthum f. kanehirae]